MFPANEDIRLLGAMMYFKRGEYGKAVLILKKIVQTNEANAKARVVLGAAYLALRQYNNARLELMAAIGYDPDLSEGARRC